MSSLGAVLVAYREASGRDAALWEWRGAGQPPRVAASSGPSVAADVTPPGAGGEDVAVWAAARGWSAFSIGTHTHPAWVIIAPAVNTVAGQAAAPPGALNTAFDGLLANTLPHVRRLVRERDGATHELAERYEEISLLYAIGELLGSGASVESVAFTVLRELAQTVGAPRGALMLHDVARDVLEPAALLGIDSGETTIVSVRDDWLLAVRAFRTGDTCVEDGGAAARRGAPLLAADGGPVLAVPIRRTSAEGTTSLGAVVLARRSGDAPFSAGDRKLVTAIASQVGTALHNARLVRAALDQEQLAREMRLANELQLKLLPDPSVVGPEARAAARVVPAESVGGDFYLLARLGPDRTGVVIGDVSGHGYQAALVMALAMSATAIHVQAVIDPGVALDAVRRSLADELESTEMSITLFYGVIDDTAGVLRFANAGHPHAFILRRDGSCTRLDAQVPPLGFGDETVLSAEVSWSAGDELLLFTDGVADARNATGERFGESAVLRAALQATHVGNGGRRTEPHTRHDDHVDARLHHTHPRPDIALTAIFDAVREFVGTTPLIDDLAVVVVDRAAVPSIASPHTIEPRAAYRAPA